MEGTAEMKAELINPFIESVQEIFGTMLGTSATRGEVSVSRGEHGSGDLLALIGISGDSKGTVAVSFPTETALQVVGQFTGTEYDSVDETVIDGIAEMINMITGGAKAKLNTVNGRPIDMGLPSVVRGKDYQIDYQKNTIWLEVPFDSSLGSFVMSVTFESSETAN